MSAIWRLLVRGPQRGHGVEASGARRRDDTRQRTQGDREAYGQGRQRGRDQEELEVGPLAQRVEQGRQAEAGQVTDGTPQEADQDRLGQVFAEYVEGVRA